MKKILLFMIMLSLSKCFAQTATIQSLKNVLDNYKKDDTLKISMLYNCSDSLQGSDIEQSIKWTVAGMQLAAKLNRPDLAASGDLKLAYDYDKTNREDSAVIFALEGLKTAEKLRLGGQVPYFYSQLGESYRLLHNYELALYYDNKYLDIATSQKKRGHDFERVGDKHFTV